jgi:hypothetical protein
LLELDDDLLELDDDDLLELDDDLLELDDDLLDLLEEGDGLEDGMLRLDGTWLRLLDGT